MSLIRGTSRAIALCGLFTVATAIGSSLPAFGNSVSREPKLRPRPGKPTTLKLYELVRLGDVLVASGQIERAIEFYNDFRFNFAKEAVYWRRFARLYEQVGDLERALGCLDHVPKLEGTELADVVRQAELLWRLRRPAPALARLVGSREQARADDTTFWRLLYDLAWSQEEDLLALEALRNLWRAQRDLGVALDLFQLIRRTGNYDEAAAVVIETLRLSGLPNPDLLLSGVEFALEGRRMSAAAEMVRLAEAQPGYKVHPELPLARALLAVERGRLAAAEADFRGAMALGGDDEACPAWLSAAVLYQSRAATQRALSSCAERERRRPGSWDLLADAYRIAGRPLDALEHRQLARQRATWAEPREYAPETPAIEIDLQEAMDREDRPTVARLLASAPATLKLRTRVAALETLDRHDDAFALLEDSGFTSEDRIPANVEEATLLRRAYWLKEDHLDGVWADGVGGVVGDLVSFGWQGRVEQRIRRLTYGLEARQLRLTLPRPIELGGGGDEIAAAAIVRRRRGADESTLKLGAQRLPTGWQPLVELRHVTALLQDRLAIESEIFLGRLPGQTAALRTHALLDGVSASASLRRLPHQIELRGAVEAGRLAARDRDLIGWQGAALVEGARRYLLSELMLRPRVYLAHDLRHHDRYLPTSLLPALTRGVPLEGFWLDSTTSAGAGLAIGNALGQPVDGRGPHVALRWSAQGVASLAVPALVPAFGVEGSVGAVLARHQELGLAGFFYSGFQQRLGERSVGLTLTYAARWF